MDNPTKILIGSFLFIICVMIFQTCMTKGEEVTKEIDQTELLLQKDSIIEQLGLDLATCFTNQNKTLEERKRFIDSIMNSPIKPRIIKVEDKIKLRPVDDINKLQTDVDSIINDAQ